jgi:hypothetical protein
LCYSLNKLSLFKTESGYHALNEKFKSVGFTLQDVYAESLKVIKGLTVRTWQ